jgi:TonB family protein
MNATFRNALLISFSVHLIVLAGLPRIDILSKEERRKSMVVDYVVLKEEIESFVREGIKKEALETPRAMLREPVLLPVPAQDENANKKKDNAKEVSLEQARREKTLKSTSDYISYYQLIREEVRRRLKANYRGYSSEGEVCLIFTLSSEGALLNCGIEHDKSSGDKVLQEIALRSLKEAAPFAPFPKGLTIGRMSFNLVVSFKRQ